MSLDKLIHEHLLSLHWNIEKATPIERALFLRMKDVCIAYADKHIEGRATAISHVIEVKEKNEKLIEGLNQINRFLDKGIPIQYTQTPKQIIANLLKL